METFVLEMNVFFLKKAPVEFASKGKKCHGGRYFKLLLTVW
jgi:hypothetical protein